MSPSVQALDKYRSTVREYDAVLEHARAVSSSLLGITPEEPHLNYGEQIFVKLIAHCVTLRALAPDPDRKVPSELWDLPSMSAVARCIIEAHDAFMYIAVESLTKSERTFRIRLWELHDKTRRLKMLEAIGSKDPRNAEILADSDRLLSQITAEPFYASLQPGVKRKIADGNAPAYYLSQRERCNINGISFDYYNAITMQLSQYVHTLPFSVHQLFQFRAGTTDALALMSLPLQYALPFLARITDEMKQLFPNATPSAPSRTVRSMATWRAISARGVKSAG